MFDIRTWAPGAGVNGSLPYVYNKSVSYSWYSAKCKTPPNQSIIYPDRVLVGPEPDTGARPELDRRCRRQCTPPPPTGPLAQVYIYLTWILGL